MRQCAYYLFLLFFVIGCKSKQPALDLQASKDSLVSQYLKLNDSVQQQNPDIFDDSRTNVYYRILNAYHSKSPYAQEIIKDEMESLNKYLSVTRKPSRVLNLKSQNIREGYQFSYGRAFSKFGYCLTILEFDTGYSVHVQIFKAHHLNEEYNLLKEYDQPISEKEWESVLDKLKFADFWGLSSRKEQAGFDGDALTINGIVKKNSGSEIVKSHSVNRRFVGGTAFYEPYAKLLDILKIDENTFN